MQIADDKQAAIRERAYHLWEAAGRPEGQADAHWRQATEEVLAPPMTTPDQPKAKKSPARKATTIARKATTATKKAPAKK